MDFRYPRIHFAIIFLVLSTILAGSMLLLSRPGIDPFWLYSFGALLFLLVCAYALSPMATRHSVSDASITLCQGIHFKADIPFAEIQSVSRLEARVMTFGMVPLGSRGRIVLAGGNRNTVSIKLKRKRRFGQLLWRSSDEIIIDLVEPDRFVKLANERLNR